MKTVVTMTCWTKRINQMPRFLDNFFATQTKKPDIFYIWLATEEFPDHNLPIELVNAIQKYGIILKWVEKNEYCHKRWRVYPEHYEDIVISLDEDVRYVNDLVERAGECKCITNLYVPNSLENLDEMNNVKYIGFCGQCIIPPKTFPLEAYDEKYLNDRLELSPKCDECWINVFLVKNHIKVTNDISLTTPTATNYTCAYDETALWKTFQNNKENNKGKIFNDLINRMVSKYHFEFDNDLLEGIKPYINIT